MTRKIGRDEIDGTVKGRAVLLIVNIDDPNGRQGVMHDFLVEGEHGCTDPHLSADRLWEATKDDWPNHTHTILLNERARYLMAARRMKRLIDVDCTVDQYLEG